MPGGLTGDFQHRLRGGPTLQVEVGDLDSVSLVG